MTVLRYLYKAPNEVKLGFDEKNELVFLLDPINNLKTTGMMDYKWELTLDILKVETLRYHYW